MNFLNVNPFSFSKRIGRPLILDGAMGSLLLQRGFASRGSSWMTTVNNDSPESVYTIHKEYIDAGADIITTNTFRTNPVALEDLGKVVENVKNAVSIAKSAVGDLPVFIAGSNAPAEDCYQKERKISYNKLEKNHINHIDLLIDNGVHLILNETQSHFDEIKIICQYCSSNSIPYVLSLFIDRDMRLLSGEKFEYILDYVWEQNPLSVGVNCISPELFARIHIKIKRDINFGYYLNCGSEIPGNDIIRCRINAEKYSDIVNKYSSPNPSFVGACCGSSPEHIKAIKKAIDG